MKTLIAKGLVKIAFMVVALLFIATYAQAETYYFHNDQLGTPKVVTRSTQDVVWRGVYDPFGKVTETVEVVEQNIRFPGQYIDQETELHYNFFRTYDPSVGRYLTYDPLGLVDGPNAYSYVRNDPVASSDTRGLFTDGIYKFVYETTKWTPSQQAIDFSAGFGDTVSLGATSLVRDLQGTNNMVNKCSSAYSNGGYAALVSQVGATGLSLAARGAVRGMSQAQMRRGMTPHMRSLYPTGGTHQVHHLNPLKGHPTGVWPRLQRVVGNTAVFPTGALPASIRHGRANVSKVSNAMHTYLHKRTMMAEAVAKTLFHPATLPARGAMQIAGECGCI